MTANSHRSAAVHGGGWVVRVRGSGGGVVRGSGGSGSGAGAAGGGTRTSGDHEDNEVADAG